MEIVLIFILLILGFTILIASANFLVNGAAALAVKLLISELVVGLTIVAFGTSSPELIVNIIASINKNTDITLGNIIGSNIMNILLVLGIAGTIKAMQTRKNTVWREIPFSLLAAFVIFVMCNDYYLDGSENIISRGDGLVLLLFFSIFLTYTFAISKIEIEDKPEIKIMGTFRIIAYILIGLSGLIIGGKLVVDYAIKLAGIFGVSDKLIGLTIVATGTSLPELVTSAVAAYKKKSDIAIGNIVGSNIFNIFLILGISAVITPLPFNISLNIDLMILIISSLFLFFTMFTGEKRTLDRWEAIIFLCLFSGYLVFIINRG